MFLAALAKEFKLVFRDLHSVLVLFAMPSAFIIIMSLAMQDEFSSGDESARVEILLYNASSHKSSKDLVRLFQDVDQFTVVLVDEDIKSDTGYDVIRTLVGREDKAYLYIPEHYEVGENSTEKNGGLSVWLSPKINTVTRQLIVSSLMQAVVESRMSNFLAQTGMPKVLTAESIFSKEAITANYLYREDEEVLTPTAVQQNVPAWLIFSMFFVVIPIATTMVTEKQQGTLNRLRTMDVSMALFLCAKIVPYLIINQFQLLLMLLLGIYVVPLLGGDRLVLGDSYAGLLLMSFGAGFAAVGYGLFIAVIVKTTEQATSIGGVGNILLGAIGGIMVPKFLMPDAMQAATVISPMSWGLDGFLKLFLSNEGIADILPEAGMLIGFGLLMLLLSMLVFNRQR
jgi:ABC-2 type transport system permease protein